MSVCVCLCTCIHVSLCRCVGVCMYITVCGSIKKDFVLQRHTHRIPLTSCSCETPSLKITIIRSCQIMAMSNCHYTNMYTITSLNW